MILKMATPMHVDIADRLEINLISCAKNSLDHDISEAKAWLLTAKVLYPHKFGVQVSETRNSVFVT